MLVSVLTGCMSKEEKFQEAENACFVATQNLLETEFKAHENSCKAYDDFITEAARSLDWLVQASGNAEDGTGITEDTPLFAKDNWMTRVNYALPQMAANASPAMAKWISDTRSGQENVRATLNSNFKGKVMDDAFERYRESKEHLHEVMNGVNPGQADSLMRLMDMALNINNIYFRYSPEPAFRIGGYTVEMNDSIANAREYLKSYKTRYKK